MNTFNWTKAVGLGVLIWAIMALALWVLGGFESVSPLWAHGIVAAVGGLSAVALAAVSKSEAGTQAAEYGLSWAIMVVLLDVAATQWFDAHIFTAWQYWLGIALVLISPWVTYELQEGGTHSRAV